MHPWHDVNLGKHLPEIIHAVIEHVMELYRKNEKALRESAELLKLK